MTIFTDENPLPIAVLISGNGSNLQALIEAIALDKLPAKICVVISNNPLAYGLQRAQAAAIPTAVIAHQQFASRALFDAALLACLQRYQPQLIVLAGFMRILGQALIAQFPGRILNIHPALLPKYPGLNTHQAVIDAGEKQHGSTVHVVTEALDAGPLIAQACLSVEANDDVKTLQARVQTLEHQLYPAVIKLYAQGDLQLDHLPILFQGQPVPASGLRFQTGGFLNQ